jgi:hypothetical protein
MPKALILPLLRIRQIWHGRRLYSVEEPVWVCIIGKLTILVPRSDPYVARQTAAASPFRSLPCLRLRFPSLRIRIPFPSFPSLPFPSLHFALHVRPFSSLPFSFLPYHVRRLDWGSMNVSEKTNGFMTWRARTQFSLSTGGDEVGLKSSSAAAKDTAGRCMVTPCTPVLKAPRKRLELSA